MNNVVPGLTPEQRVDYMIDHCAKINAYLKESPPVVLTAKQRVAVMICARQALHCKECASLGRACLYPGTAFKVLHELPHEPKFPMNNDKEDSNVASTLLGFVHSVVHHESKFDSDWYHAALQALDETKLVPGSYQGDSRRSLLCSLFCEIVIFASVSQSIQIAFLSMERKTPPLPTLQEMDDDEAVVKRSLLDMSKLLKKGAVIRQDPSMCFAYALLYKDFDRDLLEEHVSEFVSRHVLSNFVTYLLPFAGYGFVPHDVHFLWQYLNCFMYHIDVRCCCVLVVMHLLSHTLTTYSHTVAHLL